MKFVFFGYDFSLPVLERLLEDEHELLALFTFECDNVFNFNREIIKKAQDLGVPFTLARPAGSEIEYYTDQGAQLFLACGYPYKIPPIDETRAYGVNTHPSLLPKGRGLMPTPYILMHHPEAAGFSIHKITADFDAGDILYQEAIELSGRESVDSYSAKIARRTPEAISRVIAHLPDYWDKANPQDPQEASHFPPPDETMRTFDWTKTVEEIDKVGRAFGSFGSLAPVEGALLAVFDYKIEQTDHGQSPGAVIERSSDSISIAAENGVVTLTRFMQIK
ncbi:MAG: hypothetical protein KDJ35_08510 [Alphaproteobacteria bacterium]|nr:hypothetical protein [Alphaproteobacteria bacterium]